MPRVAASDLPRPVVKWAGGKAKLAEKLIAWMPERIATYVEPFCGGAAVFFALVREHPGRFERAVLTDQNAHLIACYRAIRDHLGPLKRELEKHANAYRRRSEKERKEYFYRVRRNAPAAHDVVARGARVLFLNKTCFNGLWRENSSGKNNVPFGRYENPKIMDEPALDAAHEALQRARLEVADFQTAPSSLVRGDFVYFDPPYLPVSSTANFTAYAKGGFGHDAQMKLRSLLHELDSKGVGAMLSNSGTPEAYDFYRRFVVREVPMARSINSDPTRRGAVPELVVFNRAASVALARAS